MHSKWKHIWAESTLIEICCRGTQSDEYGSCGWAFFNVKNQLHTSLWIIYWPLRLNFELTDFFCMPYFVHAFLGKGTSCYHLFQCSTPLSWSTPHVRARSKVLQAQAYFISCEYLSSLSFLLLQPHFCMTNSFPSSCFTFCVNAGVWRGLQVWDAWLWKCSSICAVAISCSVINMLFNNAYVSSAECRWAVAERLWFISKLYCKVN